MGALNQVQGSFFFALVNMKSLKLIIIFIATIILFGLYNTESVICASQDIDIKYITSYSVKSMGDVVPSMLYFDH